MSESKHTPGPWRWEVNPRHKSIELSGGKPKFDKTVMSFGRWGINGATPLFSKISDVNREYRVLVNASTFSVVCSHREHHADWFQLVDHPDANLIAAAPDLLDALDEIVNYKGGADSALEDENVVFRAVAALEKAKRGQVTQ